VDIIEGVHDNAHNQVAFHTKPGGFPIHLHKATNQVSDHDQGVISTLPRTSQGPFWYTWHFHSTNLHPTHQTLQQRNGSPNLVCDGTINDNSGCGTLEWSRASYGEYFDSQGGGVFATKWDENEITACTRKPIETIDHTRISSCDF